MKAIITTLLLGLAQKGAAATSDCYSSWPRHRGRHPLVRTADYCTKSVDRQKKPVEPVDEIVSSVGTGQRWVDPDWNSYDTIVFTEKLEECEVKQYEHDFGPEGTFYFGNWETVYPNVGIFKTNYQDMDWREPTQGQAGTCVLIASMAAAAEFPELIYNVFQTKETNSAGVAQLRFFVRGRPQYVNIDDQFIFKHSGDASSTLDDYLFYATVDNFGVASSAMWPPMIEKAWAKIRGNYYMADMGDDTAVGINSLTGAPTFTYQFSNSDLDYFPLVEAAESLNYVMGLSSHTLSCGIASGHAYSLITAFQMTDAAGKVHKVAMVRNPWGYGNYRHTWNPSDENWTQELIAQVPFGIDPTDKNEKGECANGVFIVPMEDLNYCFTDLVISHYRDGEGYKTTWKDYNDASNSFYRHTINVPVGSGEFYVASYGYTLGMIPEECSTNYDNQEVTIYVWQGSKILVSHSYVFRSGNPVLVPADYDPSTPVHVDVQHIYAATHPAKDFTLTVYGKFNSPLFTADSSETPPTDSGSGTFEAPSADSLVSNARSSMDLFLGFIYQPGFLWDLMIDPGLFLEMAWKMLTLPLYVG